MKYSEEVEKKIIAAIGDRMPGRKLGACDLCHTSLWQLVPAFVALITTDEPMQVTLGGSILPSAILYCTNCGNTHLLNLKVLGLGDLLIPDGTKLPNDQ